jgi:signal transduction histidine kinase
MTDRVGFGGAHEGEARLRFLADASRILATSLEYETTLANAARVCVPHAADSCAIDRVEAGAVARVAFVHRSPARAASPAEDERLASIRAHAMQTGTTAVLDGDARVIAPLAADGRAFGAMTFAYDDSGRRYDPADVAMLEEIARRAALAIDHARAHRDALRASQAKDEFLAALSHELRTPLSAVLGWARLLRAGDLDPPARARALDTIERSALAQSRLVDDLLDVSRIVAGTMRLHVVVCDLADVVEGVVESLRPAAAARGVAVQTAFDVEGRTITGDPERLQQVAWNLVSNAIKFAAQGGHVEVTLARVGDQVELAVVDDGCGIAPSLLPHVFERFRGAHATTARANEGLGLGLAIARHVVELHGGSIRAESEGEGRGATLRAVLPAHEAKLDAPSFGRMRVTARSGEQTAAPSLAGLRVLAVDDDEDARELLAAVLGQLGAAATVVGSARDAFGAIDREPYDVLLSDIAMPEEDGYSLLRRVRAHPDVRRARVPAAALTAFARAEDGRRAIAAGYQVHLAKPVEAAVLASVVKRLAS